VGLLIGDQVVEQELDGLLVADQIVVDDESNLDLLGAESLQLGKDLRAGLQAWAAAKGDDDVAKLALKRTAARELHAAEQIMVHVEQIEARRRHLRHVGLGRLLIAAALPAALPIAEKLGPGLLGLADENHIGQVVEIVFLDADPGAARPATARHAPCPNRTPRTGD